MEDMRYPFAICVSRYFSEQIVLLNLYNLELSVNVNEVLFHLGPTLTFKLVAHILLVQNI